MIYEYFIYLLIFLIASIIPILLFIKFRLYLIVCVLISLVLTILIMNIYFFSPLPQGKTGEFYEIFWPLPPIFVFIVGILYKIFSHKRKIEARDTSKSN